MRNDPTKETPALFLERDGGTVSAGDGPREQAISAEELRRHIEAENGRLAERGEFASEPIRVVVEWRRAANMALLDTPGLISASQARQGVGDSADDASLRRQSRAVEELVLRELAPSSRLILCLEDTSDWALAHTRAVVVKADPHLSRTVLVATKLDAKLAQFAMAEDLHRLLHPRDLALRHPRLLAGPIFTSVPPMMASKGKSYVQLLEENEASLKALLRDRLGSDVYADRIGIASLRTELAPHVGVRWTQQLTGTSKALEQRMAQLHTELEKPPPPPTADALDDFAERFGKAVHALIKGTVHVSAAEHGETLEQERQASGSGALCPPRVHVEQIAGEADDADAPVVSARNEEEALWLHANKRLYGGAQYWRALQEFMLGAIQGPAEEVTAEEILNAMGFDGYHDGVNYMRAVCVIVVEKAKGCFEQNLSLLRLRLLHVMRRLAVPVDEMLRSDSDLEDEISASLGSPSASSSASEAEALLGGCARISREQHAQYMAIAQPLYAKFVEQVMDACLQKCLHDVEAITKYVVWDSNSATRESLYNVFVQPVAAQLQRRADDRRGQKRKGDGSPSFATYEELVASFTEVLTSRRVSEEMRMMITQLVAEIISAWRQEFCRMISLKLNSFFLMPFCEMLPKYMRRSLSRIEREQALSLGELNEEEEAGRIKRLRSELDLLSAEKDELHRIAAKMRSQQGALARTTLSSRPVLSLPPKMGGNTAR